MLVVNYSGIVVFQDFHINECNQQTLTFDTEVDRADFWCLGTLKYYFSYKLMAGASEFYATTE